MRLSAFAGPSTLINPPNLAPQICCPRLGDLSLAQPLNSASRLRRNKDESKWGLPNSKIERSDSSRHGESDEFCDPPMGKSSKCGRTADGDSPGSSKGQINITRKPPISMPPYLCYSFWQDLFLSISRCLYLQHCMSVHILLWMRVCVCACACKCIQMQVKFRRPSSQAPSHGML